MSLFKEHLVSDAQSVFFNTEEFAELHNVDGNDIPIVIDSEELQHRKANSVNPEDGIHDAELLFYAEKVYFTSRPVVDKMLTLDGKKYRTVSVSEDISTYTIALHRARS
ncbi:hypothetical protein ABE354_08560 [Brevibacillus laterosporus]|uniref:hypothetical protein n=1 Tax=Brevibacillus laterosporus TaxID=1465 RepID=UPI003D1DEE83